MANPKQTAQDFVPISDVKENVVVFKDGRMCSILLASSINFALKSVDEQRAILEQFQALLNTLDFSIQFYTQSRRLDIEPYLDLLRAREPEQDNDLMRIQLREYIEFIKTFVTEVDIMAKNFFVVIPYTPATLNLNGGISSFLGNKRRTTETEETTFEENRLQLEQRATLVAQGLNRIGVRTITLENEALVELYYHIFNPGDVSGSAPEQQH